MDDFMMPNDGSFYQSTEPEEQVLQRKASVSKALAAKPMLLEIIENINADIAQMSSIDAITVDPETDPQAFLKALFAVQQVKEYAEAKVRYIEIMLDM